MSWTARRSDEERGRALRLIVLRGASARIQFQRDGLRRELALEWQRCGSGPKSPAAIALEERLRLLGDEATEIFGEIRELSARSAA